MPKNSDQILEIYHLYTCEIIRIFTALWILSTSKSKIFSSNSMNHYQIYQVDKPKICYESHEFLVIILCLLYVDGKFSKIGQCLGVAYVDAPNMTSNIIEILKY